MLMSSAANKGRTRVFWVPRLGEAKDQAKCYLPVMDNASLSVMGLCFH